MRCLEFRIPGLWHDVGDAVNGTELFNDSAIAEIDSRIRRVHQDLIDWMEDYKAHCVRLSLVTPPTQELAMRRELFGASLECLCIVKRLLATVCDMEREKLEGEAQALAHLLIELQKQPSSKHSWLFTPHEKGIAYGIIDTKDEWECHLTCESEYERRIATRRRYNSWNESIRMMH